MPCGDERRLKMEQPRKPVLRVGLLGFGSMGRTHTWAVRNLPFHYGNLSFRAETAAVCTTTMEKSRRVCAEFGIAEAYDRVDELIARSDIDIIDVCTPNIYHYDAVKVALAAGKHVLCEKPLATTPAQADELANLAAQSGRVCGMVFNNRWLAPVLRAKQLLDEGRVGRVLHFHAAYLHNSCIDPERRVGWKQDKTVCGGGVLFDLGSHVIDLMMWLCGPIVRVSGMEQIAYASHPDRDGNEWATNADEAFYLTCRTAADACGTITVSKITQGANDDLSFEIYGEKGALRFSLMEPNFLEFYDVSAPAAPQGGTRGFTHIECVNRYPDRVFPSPKAPAGWLNGHLESMRAYLSAVAGNCPFAPSFSDGAAVQRVMDAAYRSAANRGVLSEVPVCL